MKEKTPFCATSENDQTNMFEFLGISDFDELFESIPKELRTKKVDIPKGLSEMEMMQHIKKIASKNKTNLINFCGGGFYDHYIPAAVNALSSRGEFYTAYTPYQPEASQGTLQAAFEYQTAICRLTDMDVANASLFDGGSAMIEGVMMALRHTRRNKVIVDEGASPIYRKMLKTYTNNLSVDYEEIPIGKNGVTNRKLFFEKIDESVGAVVFQNPNFFGCLDDFSELIDKSHEIGALVVMSVYPMSLSLLETPGSMGVDIVTGEGQSLGLPLNFGGPYLGFFAAKKELVRKMPGRIVGETEDINGKRGFVLTLQAREQHIRREKATSNICSNVQVCALRAIIYLSLVGREGFLDVGRECMDRANYAWNRFTSIEGISPAFNRRFFNEFAINLPVSAKSIVNHLIDEGIAGGFPVSKYYDNMENILLVAFTEKRTKEEIDIFATKIESFIKGC